MNPWENPVWKDAGYIHDWRTHVPEDVKAIWLSFNVIQRVALYEWAKDLADSEEWE